MRARDLGIVIGEYATGPFNAITDVPGVLVGHVTLVEGHGELRVGRGPVRTGVTVVRPNEAIWHDPVFAGGHRLNGNGELTGMHWVDESGLLTSPVALTNTHSVGAVRDALAAIQMRGRRADDPWWSLPVVGETWDGVLNDIDGQHVKAEHVARALAAAATGAVPEGSVGGGTGMICHDFKGGIGTASRVYESARSRYTVGVLVQANHGRRKRLRVNGVPVGEIIGPTVTPLPAWPGRVLPGAGSIIVVAATDAPLLPHQCRRLAQRAGLAIARTGGVGEQLSGDLFLAFSTANRGLSVSDVDSDGQPDGEVPVRMATDAVMTPLFDILIEATEEAVVNALVAAETMTGRDDLTVHAIPHDELQRALSLG